MYPIKYFSMITRGYVYRGKYLRIMVRIYNDIPWLKTTKTRCKCGFLGLFRGLKRIYFFFFIPRDFIFELRVVGGRPKSLAAPFSP